MWVLNYDFFEGSNFGRLSSLGGWPVNPSTRLVRATPTKSFSLLVTPLLRLLVAMTFSRIPLAVLMAASVSISNSLALL